MEMKIERWAVQLARDSGAIVEMWEDTSGTERWINSGVRIGELVNNRKYRIANKTADGLRLDELLDQAEWRVSEINCENGRSPTLGLDTGRSDVSRLQGFLFETCSFPDRISEYSLKKPAPKMRPMTGIEIDMLPKGTTFYMKNSDQKFYSPPIVDSGDGVLVGDLSVSEWEGYILPLAFGLNKLEVEVTV